MKTTSVVALNQQDYLVAKNLLMNTPPISKLLLKSVIQEARSLLIEIGDSVVEQLASGKDLFRIVRSKDALVPIIRGANTAEQFVRMQIENRVIQAIEVACGHAREKIARKSCECRFPGKLVNVTYRGIDLVLRFGDDGFSIVINCKNSKNWANHNAMTGQIKYFQQAISEENCVGNSCLALEGIFTGLPYEKCASHLRIKGPDFWQCISGMNDIERHILRVANEIYAGRDFVGVALKNNVGFMSKVSKYIVDESGNLDTDRIYDFCSTKGLRY
jgi:hypothetical protein